MNALNSAIYSQLSGGTALVTALGGTAIYHLQAPEKAPLPYVVYNWQGGGNVNVDSIDRNETIRFIRTYAVTAKQAGEIDDLVKARLDKVNFTVTGYNTVFSRREDDYESVETTPTGEMIYTVGGMYRIRITK